MAETSAIEWTDATFNPWVGCTKISPACDHCYAEGWAKRSGSVEWGGARRRTSAATWRMPIKLNERARAEGRRIRVFCASLADVFDNQVPAEWRADLWELIARTPHLDWLLLTKRIGNAKDMLPVMDSTQPGYRPWNEPWPWCNVWIGATIANQAEADRDIPKLLATPAAVRFLSMELLLGPVDLTALAIRNDAEMDALRPLTWASQVEEWRGTSDTWEDDFEDWFGRRPDEVSGLIHPALDWIITGGESGPGARPSHPDWFRAVRDQCAAAGVPFLFKQWGDWKASLDRERDDPDWRADYTNDYVDHGKSRWLNLAGGCGFHGERFHVMRRVGKKMAGRALDGIIHDGFPTASARGAM